MVDVSVDRGIHMRTFLPQNKIKIPLLKLLSFSFPLFPNIVEFYLRRDICLSRIELNTDSNTTQGVAKDDKKAIQFFYQKIRLTV